MNIIMIDFSKYRASEVQTLVKAYSNVCEEPLLVLPKDITFISSLPTKQLIKIRDFINKELENKI